MTRNFPNSPSREYRVALNTNTDMYCTGIFLDI